MTENKSLEKLPQSKEQWLVINFKQLYQSSRGIIFMS